MRYIIASDYDGTLRQNGIISERTLRAIKRFRDAGHLFGVVTGRDYVSWTNAVNRNLACPVDFVILANGALCLDEKLETIFSTPFPAGEKHKDTTLACALINRYFELECTAGGISFERSRMDFSPQFPLGGKSNDVTFASPDDLSDVSEAVLSNVYWATLEEATEAITLLRQEFGAQLNPVQNGRYVDISAAGVDKATGIAKYADVMNIPLDNIWTVGDNYNDIPMLSAYHGCGIKSGPMASAEVVEFLCDEVADVVEMLLSAENCAHCFDL